ncbi:hypothetical protein [Lactobacillus gallinarum]|uniref:hypothetical protein n=1 Tax=Lactobacillus gallinarum TaxID=52242 RepID=UPI000B389F67|nr:hypothetical protein [Lactobacillus gallinarum]OUP99818.1 hypothetical protein B5E95_07985 [Lactobacillus gallinarum]OUQ47347.1 hypothetical protein B5E63_07700 [Lactobacillus gallinarum]
MRKATKFIQLLLIVLTLLVGSFCATTAWMAFNNGDQKVMFVALICALICFVGAIAYLKMILSPAKEETEEDHQIKVSAAYQTLSILDHVTIGASIISIIVSTYLKNSNSTSSQYALIVSLTLLAVWLLGSIINIICLF